VACSRLLSGLYRRVSSRDQRMRRAKDQDEEGRGPGGPEHPRTKGPGDQGTGGPRSWGATEIGRKISWRLRIKGADIIHQLYSIWSRKVRVEYNIMIGLGRVLSYIISVGKRPIIKLPSPGLPRNGKLRLENVFLVGPLHHLVKRSDFDGFA